MPPATRCTSRTYAKTSFLALAARPHPLCGTANWVTGGLAGSPDKLLTASHQRGDTNTTSPRGRPCRGYFWGLQSNGRKPWKPNFIGEAGRFFFFLEVISPWSSPFPCLVPIAWNVAAANRSKGNFPKVPSAAALASTCSLGSPPSQLRDAQRIGPSRWASARDPSIIDTSPAVSGAPKHRWFKHENRIDNI